MATKITSGTNILPNNPMTEHDLMAHLKEVKGSAGWYVFNLRCLVAAYPDDKVFKDALAAEEAKLAAATLPATPPAAQGTTDKETKATDVATVKASTSNGKAKAPSAATGKANAKGQANGK